VLQVDVWSDVVCPWCYLGKRRLAAALVKGNITAEVTWHAFELSPELPPEGKSLEEHWGKRFGMDRLREMDAKMAELGKADGIDFHFEKRTRAANSGLAHRAIRLAHHLAGTAMQDKVVEACFEANFVDGVDISDREALLGAIAPTGIDIATVRARLDEPELLDAVLEDEQLAGKIGITGVPCFIADGKLAMSGAQSVDAFVQFLTEAAA
jgi:predicted DsbA family dithiol-disulfide isomerase